MSLPLRSQIRTIASRRKCCALRARARVRVCARGDGRTPQAKEGNDALMSTERPTADHSTIRLADESTAWPATFFRNFGTESVWASNNDSADFDRITARLSPRFGNGTERAHVAPRSRGGLGAHQSPPPRGRALKPPWGAAREFLRFLPGADQSLGRGKERDY